MNSYVYIITNGKEYKIGKADNVGNRIKQLQTGNPCKLELLGVIECESSAEAYTLEKELHTIYKNVANIGEWFTLEINHILDIDSRFTTCSEVEPPYIKLYTDSADYLHGLPTATSDVLQELLKYVTYGTQEIILNAVAKKRIVEATGLAMQTLNNKLQELLKAGIIDRVAVGTFVLNPYLFGKGDWKTINELRNQNIHLSIVYDKDTGERKIKGELI